MLPEISHEREKRLVMHGGHVCRVNSACPRDKHEANTAPRVLLSRNAVRDKRNDEHASVKRGEATVIDFHVKLSSYYRRTADNLPLRE